MSVAAVVVNYNTKVELERCLESLSAWDEVIVVDNASSDRSASTVAEHFPEVKVVHNRYNVGFGPGANAGVAQASCDLVLVLNPDTWVTSEAKGILEQFFEEHPRAGVAGCGLLDAEGRVLVSARRFYTLTSLLARRIAPGSTPVREFEQLEAGHEHARVVDWVAGTGMAIRKNAFDDIGGFDDRFFLYFEDVDLCTRMWLRGWQVWYLPHAHIYHEEQRASSRSIKALAHHLKSWAVYTYKWKTLSKPAFAPVPPRMKATGSWPVAPSKEDLRNARADSFDDSFRTKTPVVPEENTKDPPITEGRLRRESSSPGESRPMKVAIEARCLLGHLTGVGRSLESLVMQLAKRDDIDLLLLAASARRTRDIHKYRFYAKTRAIRIPARLVDAVWHKTDLLPIEAFTGRCDLVHGPNFVLPSSLLPARVLTIHDLGFVRHPHLHSPSQTKLAEAAPRAIEKADRIIAVSRFTKEEICSIYGTDPEKIDVVYHGVRSLPSDGPPLPTSFPSEYLLFAGTFELRKGAAVLASAYRIARSKDPSIPPLVIAGELGLGGAESLKRTFDAGLAPTSVKLLGGVPDTQLAHLYSNATVFVFPSLYEGFGMPPIEAMAHGVPTIATDLSALPEILGDGALLVDASSPQYAQDELAEAIAQAILDVLYDDALRKSLSERGRVRAGTFSWNRSADLVVETYKRAVAQRG